MRVLPDPAVALLHWTILSSRNLAVAVRRAALYLSPKPLNDLRILQIGFRERPLPPEARELAR
jgi:hypothetical protein